jgi:fatty-acyl-CoA synthase
MIDEVIRVPNMPLAPTGKIDKMRLRAKYGGEERPVQWID